MYLVMQGSAGYRNRETQLRKGVLELAVLAALGQRRHYGYSLIRRLDDVLGFVVGEGTVYPLLDRLRRDGLVHTTLEPSPNGPARKYYDLTEEGRATLAWLHSRWESLTHGIDTLMEDSDG